MDKTKIGIGIIAVLALVIGILAYTKPEVESLGFNPATNFDFVQISQGLQIPAGPSVSTSGQGTTVQGVFHGSCDVTQATVGSFAATTSARFFCSVAGVQAGDEVHVELPLAAGINSGSTGFVVNSAGATTSNAISVDIANLTGAATSSFAQATTSVKYLIIR